MFYRLAASNLTIGRLGIVTQLMYRIIPQENQDGIVSIVIYDRETFINTPFETIEKKQLFLHIFDLTVADLRASKWLVKFPAD